ncbi:MarR-type HTH domain [Bartonella choladocola]|uniref:MarR family winged helix-turn-helix transcriptional regulator n=1 Tax=Bartonella TaxID=773 RepID=UPI0018DB4DFC|nr:MarR family transcriptional regulator [Bartonella choladocola]MBI0141483.1 MarR family transcriptional regulator [Bartonella choladocola]
MIEKNQIPALDIVQSTARMMKTLLARRLYEFGLYAGQDRIILSLALNDGQSPGSLAKQLGVKPPTVTKTIARLQEQGFVTKRGSHKDQRQLHVFLTKDGHKVVKLIEAAIAATERDITHGLNENEHVTLLKLLGRIQKNVEEQQLELSNIYAENENGIF